MLDQAIARNRARQTAKRNKIARRMEEIMAEWEASLPAGAVVWDSVLLRDAELYEKVLLGLGQMFTAYGTSLGLPTTSADMLERVMAIADRILEGAGLALV